MQPKDLAQILIAAIASLWLCPDVALADDSAEWTKWKGTYEEKVLPIIHAKCLDCHSGDAPDGEFDLSKFTDGASAVEGGDVWERVAKRVRLNEMPPPGSKGLNDPEKSTFHRWVDSRPDQDLCHKLASDETQSWYRGYVMSRRLSRSEYANAIRDLTGTVVAKDLLPPSDGAGGEGFDTVGDSLFTSPIHLEAYLRVAVSAVEQLLPDTDLASLRTRHSSSSTVVLEIPESLPADLIQQRSLAAKMVTQFARRAWRRPVLDLEAERLMSLYDQSRTTESSWVRALRAPLQATLLSPHFLFVVEPEPDVAGVQRLSTHQFATRMALLLWSSIPDDRLLTIADEGDSLFDPEVIRRELARMLEDPRARSLGENFGLQWLGLRDFEETKPDASLFPEYNDQLASEALEETIQLVANVFREGSPLTDLIANEYVTVTPLLAKHYGLQHPTGSGWERIAIPNGERGGVLTMASVLVKASYPRRTSPVLRGRWVLEEILGAKVPPPPPNVPSLEEVPTGEANLTLRQRLELHRTKPECASCHNRMDPLGFGLENYDAIGRWRTKDNDQPVDSTGTLPSGEAFNGPQELKQILLRRRDEFEKHVTRKLVGYALGRELNKFDQCIIDSSLKRLREEKRASVILEEILLSYPFQHRYYNPAKSKS